MRLRKWMVIALVALAAVAVLGAAGFVYQKDRRAQAECALVANLGNDIRQPIGDGEPLTVVGDSYSQGFGLEDPRQSWVASLGHKVAVKASSGAGFTKGGLCNGQSLVQLAHGESGTVIIQGGLNDVDADGLAPKVKEAIDKVEGDVVLVGPPLAPNLDAAKIKAVDATMAKAAADAGAKYVSAVGWNLSYSDGLHLTPASHREFGRRVGAQL
ncbi:MAG: SGNH/GDSL hydrolase family protein [Actinomycetota bacterium]|nr:SGNH/GDSL hydrolase family protein [Actinomycetota bacterium]